MKRKARTNRMKGVQRELLVAAAAMGVLERQLEVGDLAALKPAELKPSDADVTRDNLEATYLLRLFAEFESGLRELWSQGFKRKTHPQTKDLIDGCAASCRVPWNCVQDAHAVRTFRNSKVHEDSQPAPQVGFDEAFRHLCKFLSHMPPDW